MSDIIRVLRVIEYVGERSEVERVIKQSIKGTRIISNKLTINAVTVGDFAEILKAQGEPIMTNEVWCSDIYDLNSSNTTLSYDHDNLYREYAATSIGNLIDKMQDRVDILEEKLNEIRGIL